MNKSKNIEVVVKSVSKTEWEKLQFYLIENGYELRGEDNSRKDTFKRYPITAIFNKTKVYINVRIAKSYISNKDFFKLITTRT